MQFQRWNKRHTTKLSAQLQLSCKMSSTAHFTIGQTIPSPRSSRSLVLKPPHPIGHVIPDTKKFPQNDAANLPMLFREITIRGVKFGNRLWAAPMRQDSAADGHVNDWHLVHLGALAARGVGAICAEATAVVPEGRICPEDAGIWQDSHVAPLRRVVDFAHAQGTPIGIQLAHAGRKASTLAPWVRAQGTSSGTKVANAQAGGWPDNVQAPSAIPFSGSYATPKEMTIEKIEELKQAFSNAVDRCKEADLDFIEVHGAHGYLLHNFLSPISNHRTDQYGGSLENRLRLTLEVVDIIRAKWDKPLFFRISATDWYEGEERADDSDANEGWRFWGLTQTTILAKRLRQHGVDLLDVSSGGNHVDQNVPLGAGYQVPFAAHIKKEVPGLLIGAVGLITDTHQAEEILQNGEADVIFLARELMRNADFVLDSAETLQVAVQPAPQYQQAWSRMLKPIEQK